MAAMSNQSEQQGLWARLGLTWDGIAEHRPVSGLTVWLLKLAAISSALILFVAAVIIGISVTDPQAIAPKSGAMHFANMAMSFGVDGALPGVFFMALAAWQQEHRGRSVWLFFLVVSMLTTAIIGYCVAGQPMEAQFAHPLLVAKCTVALIYVMSVAHEVKQDGLNVTQVANIETRLSEQVANIETTLKAESSQLAATVKQSISDQVAQSLATSQTLMVEQVAQKLATVAQESSPSVAQIVATPDEHLTEQIAQLLALVTDQAQIIQRLTNGLADVRREVRTTITEVRSIVQEGPQVAQIAAPVVEAESDPGERVKAFLCTWSSPKMPTLQLIMDTCKVAKKTATKYREEHYGLATSSQCEESE